MNRLFLRFLYLGMITYLLICSGNARSNWTEQTRGTSHDLQSVFWVDGVNAWAVGWGGTILHSSDSGNSWIRQESQTGGFLYDVHSV